MKTRKILKHQMENNNTIHDLSDNRASQCDEKCQKRGKRNLVLLSLVFIMLFVAGYFINQVILRNVWLIVSGTLAVISSLLLFMIQVRIFSLKC
jgi:hypothetical protein